MTLIDRTLVPEAVGGHVGHALFGSATISEADVVALLGGHAEIVAAPHLPPRKNERNFTSRERERFKAAVDAMIAAGSYQRLVDLHLRMNEHRIHTFAGMVPNPTSGTMRFLPWHRVFLLRFEEELRREDARLTGQPSTLRVPYWEWTRTRQIPDWLVGWPANVTRRPGNPNALPSRLDIWLRLKRNKVYATFTLDVEGWTPQVPQGTAIAFDGAHNRVHVWVGGEMATMESPKDPLFWLHHAEVDRLWHIWQKENPGQHPTLVGRDVTMDPWTETYWQVASIYALGYRYEEETFPFPVASPVPLPV